ncbi:MAG: WS/DGAT/MGAT family O-acyltransferase [Myxococcota bacterium]
MTLRPRNDLPPAEGPSAYDRLTSQDSSLLMFEQRNTHMHVAAVAIFESGPLRSQDGGLDGPRITRYVESRLPCLPRYRQRLAFTPFQRHPVWVDDDHFDLHYHVRHTALPRPGSEEQLKHLAGRILSQPLDRDRPLWEMWVIEGLERDRFALLTKVHHCMVDGASGTSLLTQLFRPTPDDTIEPIAAWSPRRHPSVLRLGVDEVVERISGPLSILKDLAEAVQSPARTLDLVKSRGASVVEAVRDGLHLPSESELNRPIGPHRRVEWRTFDLPELKALKKSLGGTINDLVLTVVTGAIRRFLERRGEPLDDLDYRVVIPVNMRSGSGDPELANRVSAFFMTLPVSEPDPIRRLQQVQSETARLKGSRAADGIDFFTQLVERSRSTWLTEVGVRFAARVQPYNQIVSNVPGPQFPLYVLGAPLTRLFPLAPLFERQGLGTAVMSYDGRVCWGLVADRDTVPDLGALAGDLERAMAELVALASPGSGAPGRDDERPAPVAGESTAVREPEAPRPARSHM